MGYMSSYYMIEMNIRILLNGTFILTHSTHQASSYREGKKSKQPTQMERTPIINIIKTNELHILRYEFHIEHSDTLIKLNSTIKFM